jgi:hypothetical protein
MMSRRDKSLAMYRDLALAADYEAAMRTFPVKCVGDHQKTSKFEHLPGVTASARIVFRRGMAGNGSIQRRGRLQIRQTHTGGGRKTGLEAGEEMIVWVP